MATRQTSSVVEGRVKAKFKRSRRPSSPHSNSNCLDDVVLCFDGPSKAGLTAVQCGCAHCELPHTEIASL